ncbi:hypothetical protein E4U39_007632 [Claviceps sp. Clav50 group G5]|nr:hypothetical protein E4U39_007632 [Claviceps sp. Clav50 group G5]
MYEYTHCDKHHSSNSMGRVNYMQKRTFPEISVSDELHDTESEVLYFAFKSSKVALIRR